MKEHILCGDCKDGRTIVRLDGQGTTLAVSLFSEDVPRLVHWGGRLPEEYGEREMDALNTFGQFEAVLQQLPGLSLLPVSGHGFFGAPALSGHRDGRNWAARFRTVDARKEDECIEITLSDEQGVLQVVLTLEMHPETGVVSQYMELTNTGDTPYTLDWCAAAAWEVPARCSEIMTYDGSWCAEFVQERTRMPRGQIVRESRKGRPSHDGFPSMVTGETAFTETTGEVWGMHLGWSGNHRLLAESLDDGTRQVQMGELLMPGEVVLGPNETYRTPTVYGCHAIGIGDMSRRFHRFVREKILSEKVTANTRPVHYNTWEAVYCDHDPAILDDLAERAAALGVERFVLDDGWFPGRHDDTAGLGDWVVDREKYPDGLAPLINRVNQLGMGFGLWVEPEMISPDSELYRQHPDWAFHLDPAPRITGRHQLVLNLALPEVQEYLFERLDSLLCDNAIEYLKWDHNRDIAQADHQGHAAYRRNVLGLYELLERLRAAHPDVEIETCASGGARVDLGILQRTQRIWTSDSNDALERLNIQRGVSLFIPPMVMGAHVGPERCHTSGRRLDLLFRLHSAFFGSFGFEMDLRELSAEERVITAELTALHKEWRNVLHSGNLHRLSLDDPGRMGLGMIAEDRSRAVYGIYQLEAPGFRGARSVRLPGLDPERTYRVRLLGPVVESVEAMLPEGLKTGGVQTRGGALEMIGVTLAMPHPVTSLLLAVEEV